MILARLKEHVEGSRAAVHKIILALVIIYAREKLAERKKFMASVGWMDGEGGGVWTVDLTPDLGD